jgi:DNA polymerase III subunit epsilon
MKVLVFDTETSGLPTRRGYDKYFPYTELRHYDSSRIVSICWKLYENEKIISSKYFIVKPNDFEIDNTSKACEINGITQEIADKEGVLIDDVLSELHPDLYKAETIVAHNILFDQHVLLSELHRSKRRYLIQLFESKQLYCTMNKSKDLLKIPMRYGDYKSPKLIELYEFLFKEGFEGAHNAEADVEACAKCYFELIKNSIL